MAGINSLKGLRNVNLTSVKEGAKRSAALTLLLSTVACNQNLMGGDSIIIWGPLLFIFGPSVVIGIIAGIYEHFFDPPSDEGSSSPVKFNSVGDNNDIYHQQ